MLLCCLCRLIFYIYYYCSFFSFNNLFTLIAISSVYFHSRPIDIFSSAPQSSGTASYFLQSLLIFFKPINQSIKKLFNVAKIAISHY